MYPTAGFFSFLNYGHRHLSNYLCPLRNLLLLYYPSPRGLIGRIPLLKAGMDYTHLFLLMVPVWSLA